MCKRLALILAILAALALASSASAACTTQTSRVHSRHWVKKHHRVHHRWVVLRKHGKIVYVRVWYWKITHKPVCANATVPVTASGLALRAHLDPSFTQAPANPLAVTYAYSASAERVSVSAPTSGLPEGILNLYSDGLLACSINVGGSVTGGTCPVVYSATGAHQVVATYVSGSLTATETSIEHIEPFTTQATVAVTQTAGPEHSDELAVAPAVADQNGNGLGEVSMAITITDVQNRTSSVFTGTGILKYVIWIPHTGQESGPFGYNYSATGNLTPASGDTLAISVHYGGRAGYLPSTSGTNESVTVPPPN